MLYRVTVYRPSKHERCFEPTDSWVCGNMTAAQLTAESKLPPSNETDYSARVSRLPYAEIVAVKRFRSAAMPKAELKQTSSRTVTINTPINYVPSVGDLGWTP